MNGCYRLLYAGPGRVRRCNVPAVFSVAGDVPVCGRHIAPLLRELVKDGAVRVESAA